MLVLGLTSNEFHFIVIFMKALKNVVKQKPSTWLQSIFLEEEDLKKLWIFMFFPDTSPSSAALSSAISLSLPLVSQWPWKVVFVHSAAF